METFEQLLSNWRTAALKSAEAAAAYRLAHAKAAASSPAKTDAARKTEADAATDNERQARDITAIEEQTARYRVEYVLAELGHRKERAA